MLTGLQIIIVTLLQRLYPWKFKFRGATNKIIWHNHKQGQVKVLIKAWNLWKFMLEKQFQTNMFWDFMKDAYSFRRFNCNRALILDCSHNYRESTLANIGLSFMRTFLFTESCLLFELQCSQYSHIPENQFSKPPVNIYPWLFPDDKTDNTP